MSISLINDDQIKKEGRYHICLADVPNLSASEMKEFFDYLPRRVIIPKINELIENGVDADTVYSKDEIRQLLALKADTSNVYTKDQTDTLLKNKPDKETVYTKDQTDSLLSGKVDSNYVYTKTQTDYKLTQKLDKSEAYSIEETEELLKNKADIDSVYSKAETDSIIENLSYKNTGYTKAETDEMLSSTDYDDGIRDRIINDAKSHDVFATEWDTGVLKRTNDMQIYKYSYREIEEQEIPIEGKMNIFMREYMPCDENLDTNNLKSQLDSLGLEDNCSILFIYLENGTELANFTLGKTDGEYYIRHMGTDVWSLEDWVNKKADVFSYSRALWTQEPDDMEFDVGAHYIITNEDLHRFFKSDVRNYASSLVSAEDIKIDYKNALQNRVVKKADKRMLIIKDAGLFPFKPLIRFKRKTEINETFIRITNKNMVLYPYVEFLDQSSKTIDGLTCTMQKDGGIRIVGTNTSDVQVVLSYFDYGNVEMTKYSPANSELGIVISGSDSSENDEWTVNYDPDSKALYILVAAGDHDITVYPQIEPGTEATEYEFSKDHCIAPIYFGQECDEDATLCLDVPCYKPMSVFYCESDDAEMYLVYDQITPEFKALIKEVAQNG